MPIDAWICLVMHRMALSCYSGKPYPYTEHRRPSVMQEIGLVLHVK